MPRAAIGDPMTCPYPNGDPALWCHTHRRDREMLNELHAREASKEILIVRQDAPIQVRS